MQRSTSCRLRAMARDRAGAALPLALIGLVSVSLLVTTALLTSSTELAISSAHQDATRALNRAEGGLQAYVAERGTVLFSQAAQSPLAYTPPLGSAADAVTVTVTHLGDQLLAGDSLLRVFTVQAQPVQGGARRVSALVRQLLPPPDPLDLNITSAMTVAGDLHVNGNAFQVDGRSTACGSTGVEALRKASDSQLTFSGNAANRLDNFDGVNDAGQTMDGLGAIETSHLAHAALAGDVLRGSTLREIADRVPPSNWRYRLRAPKYAGSFLSDPSVLGRAPGGVAVVDAEGGTIDVPNGTYYGLLIVLGGDVNMDGNVTFNGIVLAERNFVLKGNVTINGALISLAMDGTNVVQDNQDDSSAGSGSIEVNYDKCRLDDALEAFGKAAPNTRTPIVRAISGWMEVGQ